EERIERASLEANTYLLDCQQAFTAAARGDFDSLRRLVSLFGADASLTFRLSIRAKGSLGSVQAFTLRSDGPDLVSFRTRGVVCRNRQQLSRNDFHSLLAVSPF